MLRRAIGLLLRLARKLMLRLAVRLMLRLTLRLMLRLALRLMLRLALTSPGESVPMTAVSSHELVRPNAHLLESIREPRMISPNRHAYVIRGTKCGDSLRAICM